METARRALGTNGAHPVEVRPELSEIDFGEWEMKSFEEILKADADNAARFIEGETSFVFPGGESLEGFRTRIGDFLHRLPAVDAETVILFSHGGPIRFLLCELLGIPTCRHRLFDIRCGSAADVAVDGEYTTLKGLNVHLPEDLTWMDSY